MTPQWIEDNAVISGPYDPELQYFEISPSTGSVHQIALQIQLIPPGVLKANDSVSITIISALDTSLPETGTNDILFGVSDNTSYVGFTQVDAKAYRSLSPCLHEEGDKGNRILLNSMVTNGARVSSDQYSGEIKMQFRPAEQWGSCHTEHEEGYTNIANYQHLLDLSNGLHLEIYRYNPEGIYRIKYISASVELD